MLLGRYAQPTLCPHEIRILDYWQFGRSNVRSHRTCSLPTVDSALAKIRYAQPTSPALTYVSLRKQAHTTRSSLVRFVSRRRGSPQDGQNGFLSLFFLILYLCHLQKDYFIFRQVILSL